MASYIEIREESGKVDRRELTEDSFVIGRSATADIQLDLPTISRCHAKLNYSGGKWTLADQGSRSGTRVNGEPITERVVGCEDLIQISRFTLRVVEESPKRSDRVGMSTIWGAERAAPNISTLVSGKSPKVDFSHIASLNRFGRSLQDEPDPDTRLRALCDLVAGGVLGGYWALALEIEKGDVSHPPRILCASPKDQIAQQDIHISRSTISAMQESGAPVLASNFSQSEGLVEMTVLGAASAVVACPLEEGESLWRVLYVNVPPQIATTEWLAVMSLAAKEYQQAESVWREREEAGRRAAMDRDLANARKIQMSIMPEPPNIDSLDIAWGFTPCEMVGGDLLDVIPMHGNQVMITIADVSGHGLPAALATLTVHSVVQTCVKSRMPAEQVMTMLNDHLCDYLPAGRFVTMAAVVIDLQTGQTQCVNAGHVTPLVISSEGAVRPLASAHHMVLGVAKSEMDATPDVLGPNETLFLCTDGLTELRRNGGDMLHPKGLEQLLAELHITSQPAVDFRDAISAELDLIKGPYPSEDDQAFLIVRRR